MFADGGSRGNPGPAASGAVLFDESGAVLREVGTFLGVTTNNVAEWTGLLTGLEAALELGVDDLAVRLDSANSWSSRSAARTASSTRA